MTMAVAYKHAQSSVKRWGGKEEDYLPIHEFMDSSKAAFPSNQHRAALHHSFGCSVIIPAVFGDRITNSDGRIIPTKDIAELHVLEDHQMKFIPSLQDWLEHIPWAGWMDNGRGGVPPSARKIAEHRVASQQEGKVVNYSVD